MNDTYAKIYEKLHFYSCYLTNCVIVLRVL